ncbi:MAG: FAD-dependent oxidoreductase, partial [Pirellulales bacterium]|nr:FAD-dependent oxidoreductase [Pirellulales bacterium]
MTSTVEKASEETVAIIGAGISGLICARRLVDHGFSVTIFEKSRGTGGRMAVRRFDGGVGIDHGAQYFTARDPVFQRQVTVWIDAGCAAQWNGRVVSLEGGRVELKDDTTRFVGVP